MTDTVSSGRRAGLLATESPGTNTKKRKPLQGGSLSAAETAGLHVPKTVYRRKPRTPRAEQSLSSGAG
jgi:hypothetical protein